MVIHDVSRRSTGRTPASQRSASALLGAFGCGAARLHVDLCRLSSAMCQRCVTASH